MTHAGDAITDNRHLRKRTSLTHWRGWRTMIESKPQSMAATRDTSRDGLRNKIETFLLTRGRLLWKLVNRLPWLSRVINRVIVDMAVRKAPFRPLRLTTMNDYPSWSSLTDRSWFTRYLPPKDIANLPPLDALQELYV